MNELWSQGLWVSAAGLAVTFAALGLLIGLMALLTRLFPAPVPVKDTAVATPTEPATPETPPALDNEAAVAAAIATALALARHEQERQLGQSLESDHGPWWYTDKARARARARN